MINIPHIDLKVWDYEYKIIEIIQSLIQTGHANITLDGEGSDAEMLGLYRVLDSMCDSLGCNPEAIVIHTHNQLESHPVYKIFRSPPLYISSGQQFAKTATLPSKELYDLKRFGIFISRSSWQRLWVASYIWNNYNSLTNLTYHYDSNVEYHRSHLGFDELSFQLGLPEAAELCSNFMQNLPIKNDAINSYPILTPAHFAIAKIYHTFFVEIVCETFLAGRTFYPTEKTWRPLICKTPFIVVGPGNHLANLRKLGFKTFNQWWDESYDEDVGLDNGKISIRNILSTIDRLAALDNRELVSMYNDMKPTLDHNYDVFMNLKESDFNRVWGYQ